MSNVKAQSSNEFPKPNDLKKEFDDIKSFVIDLTLGF